MKLNSAQLRQIIVEEVKKSRRLAEAGVPGAFGEDCLAAVMDAANDCWRQQYTPSDPVMAELGPDAWYEQVGGALDDLERQIADIVAAVEEKLHNGDYM